MTAESQNSEKNKAAIARQRRGKQLCAATNKYETKEDVVFHMLQLLGNSSVNTHPQQWIRMQQQKNRWRRCFLCGLCRGYIARTKGKS
jgi:hypothetical protein